MHAVASRLHASHPQPLPFAPSLLIRAYLLEREQGNLLIYGSGGLTADEAVVNGLGVVARRYLNHQHEAAFACGGAERLPRSCVIRSSSVAVATAS